MLGGRVNGNSDPDRTFNVRLSLNAVLSKLAIHRRLADGDFAAVEDIHYKYKKAPKCSSPHFFPMCCGALCHNLKKQIVDFIFSNNILLYKPFDKNADRFRDSVFV